MWKDFCFLVHGKKFKICCHENIHTRCFGSLSDSATVLSFYCSGSPTVLPEGPAHTYFPVSLPLHQQRAALFSGAEVVSLQSTLGWKWDGQEGQVSAVHTVTVFHINPFGHDRFEDKSYHKDQNWKKKIQRYKNGLWNNGKIITCERVGYCGQELQDRMKGLD